jgi:hypothetical protein
LAMLLGALLILRAVASADTGDARHPGPGALPVMAKSASGVGMKPSSVSSYRKIRVDSAVTSSAPTPRLASYWL